MPICLCSHCSHSHKVPTKNLGLQGRCKACGEVFLLVVEPSAETPPAADPEFETNHIPPVVLATPVPPPPPLLPPPPPVKEDEFNWSQPLDETDDLEDEDEDEDASEEVPSITKGERASVPRGRGEVAPLPMRPALRAIETALFVCGLMCIAVAVLVSLLGMYGAIRNLEAERDVFLPLVTLIAPIVGVSAISGIVLVALSELIAVLRALESRQHEISRNASLR